MTALCIDEAEFPERVRGYCAVPIKAYSLKSENFRIKVMTKKGGKKKKRRKEEKKEERRNEKNYSICIFCDSATSLLGRVTSRTPFLKVALASSDFTAAGSGTLW